jgi:hypothetical protein
MQDRQNIEHFAPIESIETTETADAGTKLERCSRPEPVGSKLLCCARTASMTLLGRPGEGAIISRPRGGKMDET